MVDTATTLDDGTTHWAVTKVSGCTNGCSEWIVTRPSCLPQTGSQPGPEPAAAKRFLDEPHRAAQRHQASLLE